MILYGIEAPLEEHPISPQPTAVVAATQIGLVTVTLVLPHIHLFSSPKHQTPITRL
jgi:hypothetical protein